MIKSSIEKLARDIGYDIGISDDVTQSELLNGFCTSLSNSIGQESDIEMQICYIVEKLNPKARDIMKRFAGFIELKENKPK